MRATSLLVLCCLAVLLGAHAIDTSAVTEADTGVVHAVDTQLELEHAVEAELAMDVALEQELAAEAQLDAEVEADLEMLATGQMNAQGFFKKVGAALKKVGADIKKAEKKVGAALKQAGKNIKAAVKKAGDKIKEGLVKLFDPSIKIGPPILSVKNFDEVVAKDLMLLSAMAYCPKARLNSWNCPTCGRLKLFGTWTGSKGYSTQVIVAGDKATNAIYVAYRGTMTTFKQWMADLNFGWKDWSGCAGCRVHGGFKQIFDEAKGITIQYLKAAQAAMPTADIYLTGHSMGGAVATLMSMYLHESQPHMAPTQLYTVGTPRMGNAAFRDKVGAAFGNNHYRIKNHRDMIPMVPFQAQGFRHVGVLVLCEDGTMTCFAGSNNQENPAVAGFLGEVMQTLVQLFKEVKNHLHYLKQDFSGGCPGF